MADRCCCSRSADVTRAHSCSICSVLILDAGGAWNLKVCAVPREMLRFVGLEALLH